MSGYFTRPLYDECSTAEGLKISTAPGFWIEKTPQQSEAMCFSNNGPRSTRSGNSSFLPIEYPNAVEIESSLRGLDVPLTRCMNTRTLVERDQTLNKNYTDAKKRTTSVCSSFLDLNYTRLEEPSRLTEKAYNRYDFPIIDPKEWVFNGFSNGQFATSTDGSSRDGRSTRFDSKAELERKNKEMRQNAGKFTTLAAINSEMA
jgi:hypothetical protein